MLTCRLILSECLLTEGRRHDWSSTMLAWSLGSHDRSKPWTRLSIATHKLLLLIMQLLKQLLVWLLHCLLVVYRLLLRSIALVELLHLLVSLDGLARGHLFLHELALLMWVLLLLNAFEPRVSGLKHRLIDLGLPVLLELLLNLTVGLSLDCNLLVLDVR